jgi:FAD/FMN-containing dehydrogenase
MKGLLKDLASQISGEVTTSERAREYFSTDGSIFTIKPEMIIYPRNETDVVNTVKFLSWQAQEGKVVGLTARGKGTDQSGAALGSGAVLVFPAHMKSLVDIGKAGITVQPGMPYATLQTVLHSHFQYLPPYPASIDFSSIGGAISNNAGGEKSVKYGSTRHWVNGLRVVLSNGDIIETYRLNKKELKKKKRQPDFEGHLYREVDKLITENWSEIEAAKPSVSKNSSGYDIWDVKSRDGSFDLSQLIVGSQGTLGIVTEATLRTAPYNPNVMLVAGYFDSIQKASDAVEHLLKLDPSALEVVDKNLLEFLQKNKPEQLVGLIPGDTMPEIVLLCELDDAKPRAQKKKTKEAMRILDHFATSNRIAVNKQQQDELWRVRRGAAAVIWKIDSPKKALPIIEDGIVPVDKLTEFLKEAYELFKKRKVNVAVWGHAGNGHFHIQPFMDLKNLRDRSKVFELSDEFYALIKKFGGSNSGEHNDGIMRGVYLKEMYGEKIYEIFESIKDLFDPLRFLNPGVKIDVTRQDAMVKMRKEYSMKHLDDHMPGSYNH